MSTIGNKKNPPTPIHCCPLAKKSIFSWITKVLEIEIAHFNSREKSAFHPNEFRSFSASYNFHPCMDKKEIINSTQTRPSPPRRGLPTTVEAFFKITFSLSSCRPRGENEKAVRLWKVWGDVLSKLPSDSFKWLLWKFVLWVYHLVIVFPVVRWVVQCQHV